MQSLSEQAQGRTISLNIGVQLTPQNLKDYGHTDAAMHIGHGLIKEALGLLTAAAEAEGFKVEISTTLVTVY
ncbi:hypothetical protein [Immundisolibacter sp.]